ncbi:MAG: hypothetical protein ABDK94_02455 [Atribacterota bacterium]
MKRIIPLFTVLSLLAIIALSGCGGTPQTPNPPTQPVACSLRVISSCPWCYGNVYLNGFPTGSYLITNGSVTIQNVPCGQVAAVYIIDENGFMSHTEYVTPTGPNTIVNFTYW